MKRLAVVAALSVASAAVGGCTYGGTPADPAALSIDGDVVLTVEELQTELDWLADEPDVAGALLSDATTGMPLPIEGGIEGSYNPAAAARLLATHARVVVVVDLAEANGVAPDAAALDEARTGLNGSLESIGVTLDDMPATLADALVLATASDTAFTTWLTENPADPAEIADEDIQAAFDQFRSGLTGDMVCVRHILVGYEAPTTDGPTDEEADAVRAEVDAVLDRLDGGEPFEGVAAEVSDDPGSAALGGDLGCGDPTQYVAEFAEAATTQAVGELGPPVSTVYGVHLIEVTYRGEPLLELVEEQIRLGLEQELANPEARYVDLLEQALDAVDVIVDPKFGRWSPAEGIIPPDGAADPPGAAALDPLAGLGLTQP